MSETLSRPYARPSIKAALGGTGPVTLTAVPDGMVGKALADIAAVAGRRVVFVARDGQRLAEVERTIRFFAPTTEIIDFPAWDCLPYDRASPHSAVVARRMAALSQLTTPATGASIVLTTVNAALQKVPTRAFVSRGSMSLAVGNQKPMDGIVRWLEDNGFLRSPTVREPGEYAVRGGIADLFAAGAGEPVRLDFFGDTLESIRTFDPESQRTVAARKRIDLVPANELHLSPETIARFRQNYVAEFGAPSREDLLYQSVSEGRRYVGMEHWLPLFADGMETLFDHVGDAAVVLEHLDDEATGERLAQIEDHYRARQQAMEAGDTGGVPYNALPPDRLYLTRDTWAEALAGHALVRLSPFAQPARADVMDLEARRGRDFAAERQAQDVNVFDAAIGHVDTLIAAGKRAIVACWSEGSRDRMGQVLVDHGLTAIQAVADWAEAAALPKDVVGLAVLGIEDGFETPDFAIIGEQDILGDRLVRPHAKRRPADFLTDVTSLAEGDLVVHADHGIGRFVGLKTIEAAGAPHDCLELVYAGNDRVYLPVENIELLSRYGSDQADAPLDKLGGTAWQARKARLKKRIRDMAEALMKVAAERAMRAAPAMTPPEGAYDEFAARFPYEETEDQDTAISAVFDDLSAGKPMDRLI
ncbi:MAG: transcription-repair coupling factor, partial [Bauldia sp.]|nr:transcription-repair coupling factor [Bauldia sp.]